jgi:hypothetical protein
MQPVLRTLIASMILGAAAAIPLFFSGPQLYKDMWAGTHWVAAPTLVTVASNCTRWAHVLSTCSIQYLDRDQPEELPPRLHYFFFGSWVDEQGAFLRSAADPHHVTVTLGIEHMADRQRTYAAWSAVTLGVVGLFLVSGIRTLRLGEVNQSFRRRL